MSTILPSASKTVLIGRPEYQSLLDGVRLISLGLTRKEDTAAVGLKSNILNILSTWIDPSITPKYYENIKHYTTNSNQLGIIVVER